MSLNNQQRATASRVLGLSAFVRCKNEEEYIVASLMSAYRVFDEIVVALNNSTDRTRELVDGLMVRYPKIRLLDYVNKCSPIGPGYFEKVQADPSSSLAAYYNWCTAQTSFSHVCKWDGDMIATPEFERVISQLELSDVIIFDGYDVLGEHTTDMEPRIFRYNPERARYIDWDLYEVIEHDYSKKSVIDQKCYLHMKLVKKDWLHKTWSNPNLLAIRSVPETGAASESNKVGAIRSMARKVKRILRSEK